MTQTRGSELAPRRTPGMGRLLSGLLLLCGLAGCSADSRPLVVISVDGLTPLIQSLRATVTLGAQTDVEVFTSGLGQFGLRLPSGPAVVTLHPDAAPGLADGALARLESRIAGLTVRVRLDPAQRRDVALMPKGGHLRQGQCANALIRASLTDAAFVTGDYSESLQTLAALRAPVDAFFDDVMVNADDPALRANRLGLLAKLHAAMNQVADISKLSA